MNSGHKKVSQCLSMSDKLIPRKGNDYVVREYTLHDTTC